jgi:hypothetical protein
MLVADGVVAAAIHPFTKYESRFAERPGLGDDAGCQTYLGLLKQLVAEFYCKELSGSNR